MTREQVINGIAMELVGELQIADPKQYYAITKQKVLEAFRSGMTESIGHCVEYAKQMRGAHINANTSCGDIVFRIKRARDNAYEAH